MCFQHTLDGMAAETSQASVEAFHKQDGPIRIGRHMESRGLGMAVSRRVEYRAPEARHCGSAQNSLLFLGSVTRLTYCASVGFALF